MKYFHPIRLEKLDTVVPELQATIRELNSDSNDFLDGDRYDDITTDELADNIQPEMNEKDVYWTTWSKWNDCSLSCGEGISSRTRTCMSRNPTSDIDLKCDGQSVEYKLCKVQECPEGNKDYRSKQCSDHDNERYFDKYYKWEPFTGPEGATCELQCTPSNSTDYHAFLHSFGTVVDGTRCGRQGVCINRECVNIGCDGIIGSNHKKDQCGVCNGNNSTCVRRYNTVDRLDDISSNYHELAEIPKGATNVVVKDYNRCYLALFEIDEDGNRTAVINGDWLVYFPGEYKASGRTVRYSRVDDREAIEIEGPTKKTLHLMILTISGKKQPSVEFEYWIPPELSNISKEAVSSARRVLLPALEEDDYLNLIKSEGFNGDEVELPSLPTTTVSTTTTQATTTTTEATTTTTSTQSTRGKEDLTKIRPALRLAQCNPYKKSGGKKKMFCESDFVLDVRISPWRRVSNGRFTRYMVDVVRRYKTNVRLSRREYIWLPISCRSKIRFNHQYLIMGRAKARSTNGKNVKVSKYSNGQTFDRFPREYVLLGRNAEIVRFSHKHYAKMTRMARRVKCKKNRRSVMKYARRRFNAPANVNKR